MAVNVPVEGLRLEGVDRMKVLDLQPGDVIVLECAGVLSREACRQIEERLAATLPGHKAIVLTEGMRITAARVATGEEE